MVTTADTVFHPAPFLSCPECGAQEMRWFLDSRGLYRLWCWACFHQIVEEEHRGKGIRKFTGFYSVGVHWCAGAEHASKRQVNKDDLCFACWDRQRRIDW